MSRFHIFFLLLVIIPFLFSLATLSGAQNQPCEPTKNWNFCINKVTIEDSIEPGGTLSIAVTVENVGEKLGTVRVLLAIEKPTGTRIYPEKKRFGDIPVNGTTNKHLFWKVPNNSTLGKYKINILLFDPRETHLYDSTGYVYSFAVVEKSSQNNSSVTVEEYPQNNWKTIIYIMTFIGGIPGLLVLLEYLGMWEALGRDPPFQVAEFQKKLLKKIYDWLN